MMRDFTYIDDIIESLVRLMDKPAAADPGFDPTNPDSATSWAHQWVFNIGNANSILPMQPGDLLGL
jgi:UDP-glucuronate 4-epimerase